MTPSFTPRWYGTAGLLAVLATGIRPARGDDARSGGEDAQADADDGAVLASRTRVRPRRPPAPPAPRAVPFDPRWLEPYFRAGPLHAAADRFRVDDFGAAATELARALARVPARAPERQPGRFMLALARLNDGQFEAAGPLFEELYESYPLLAPYHAYYAARCRLRRGDQAGGVAWARKVPVGHVLEAEARLLVLDALDTQQKWSELDAEAAAYLDKFQSGPRRAEATYRRAEALEALGRPYTEVAPLYRRVWSDATSESWSSRAGERLEAMAVLAPRDQQVSLRTRSAGEWLQRGMVLFDRNQNIDSEAAFAAALGAPDLDKATACKARYHRAQSAFKQRQRSRAAPLFLEAEAACKAAGDDDLLVKSQYQAGRCLAVSGDKTGALVLFARVEAQHPEHSYADDARLRAAEVATDMGDEAQAEKLLSEIPSRYPQGDLVGEAVWRLAFRDWRAGRWAQARSWLDENLRLVPHEDVWYAEGRALYWKGRIYEKENAPALARASYVRAVKEYPLSVYTLLSLERLRRTAPAARLALLKELRAPLAGGEHDGWHFTPRPVFGDPGFLRAVELARLGLGGEARRELARLGFSAPDNHEAARKEAAAGNDERADIYWIAAILLDRGRLWNASHAIPRYTLTAYRQGYPGGRRAREWQIAYPRAFPELVAKHSKLNRVPEALQLAIMREESAFNPRIESFANALGLTQLLVKTAQRFAPYHVSRDTLLDPGRNVEIGSKFLSFLLQRYSGAVPLAIAGYNAGENAVDRWLRDYDKMELDEFLESIPYDETRNYTKRVMASYAAYAWLYFPLKPVPAISFDLRPPAPSRAGRPTPRRRR